MRLSSIAVIAVAFAAACGGGDTGAADTSAADTSAAAASATPANTASGSGCLAGTYTQSSPSFSPKFVFNADGTGEETMAESQGGKTRKFTWATKSSSQVTITFPAEGDQAASSTDWNYSCENSTFASLYKKQ
jgi:hypothetical protein